MTRGDASWAWGLYPHDQRTARLITRVRMRYRLTSPLILARLLFDAVDTVMMRKYLLGIMRRAEGQLHGVGRADQPT